MGMANYENRRKLIDMQVRAKERLERRKKLGLAKYYRQRVFSFKIFGIRIIFERGYWA